MKTNQCIRGDASPCLRWPAFGGIHATRRQAGMLLVECLVYLSCLFAVLGAAMAVFFQVLEFSRDLRRNADDITRVLKAGERWRADVRAAAGPLQLETGPAGSTLHIPQAGGQVTYRFVTNALVRCTERPERCELILPSARDSRFVLEPRREVTAWRWDVELPSRLKAVRVRPVFTFTAVSDRTPQP